MTDEDLLEICREQYIYSGDSLWTNPRWDPSGISRIVGYESSGNILSTRVKTISYPVGALVFLMHHEYLPMNVGYLDGDKSNLNIDNLIDIDDSTRTFTAKPFGKIPYKGVQKHGNAYRARIMVRGIVHQCGVHGSPEDAARAYDQRALELVGPNAYLNFPKEV